MVLSTLLVQPLAASAVAQQPPPETIFRNVRVLDVVDGRLGSPTNVVIRGNTISAIGPSSDAASETKAIDGKGRTLMPGLIDVHVHLTFGAVSLSDLHDPRTTPEQIGAAAAKSATDMLLRGFTAVRDMGGPIFPLKRAIDSGKVRGPRIWPSGAIISQTSGHGDFRTPDERSRRFFGKPSRAEEEGATFIADGRDEVLTATRENLRMGASQIKIMGGGGTSCLRPYRRHAIYSRRDEGSGRCHRMVTYNNAQLLALSGPRAPYAGKLGVVQVGALADLLLVEGDPLKNIDLIADPRKNFSVIMRDGIIYKDD